MIRNQIDFENKHCSGLVQNVEFERIAEAAVGGAIAIIGRGATLLGTPLHS